MHIVSEETDLIEGPHIVCEETDLRGPHIVREKNDLAERDPQKYAEKLI